MCATAQAILSSSGYLSFINPDKAFSDRKLLGYLEESDKVYKSFDSTTAYKLYYLKP